MCSFLYIFHIIRWSHLYCCYIIQIGGNLLRSVLSLFLRNFFEFSFFVFISHEFMLHLGCIWWKKLSSSSKTFFTHFVLTFVYLMSSHEIWDFPRFTWCNVNQWIKTHLVAHIFITYNKKPSFSKIGQHLCAPEVFLGSVPSFEKHRSHGWTPQLW